MDESERDTAEHDEESLMITMSTSLRILVVDDDATFLAIVSGLLKILKHEVVTFRNPLHALSTLRVKKSYFDLVITDVHMPQIDGFEMQKRVQEDFKLPLIMISADDRESVMLKALKRGVALYIVKPVSLNDLKNIWQYVVTCKKGKKPAFFKEITSSTSDEYHDHDHDHHEASGDQSISPAPAPPHHAAAADDDDDDDYESRNNSASSSSSATNSSKRKREKDNCNQHHHHHRNKNDPAPTAKKAKVIWTNTLQTRFLEAINFIGLERSVPKKILEAMNVQGLTRENVASHLQKYRMFLKKVAERTRAANSLAAKSKYLNSGLNRSSTILDTRFSSQHQIGGTSSQLRFQDNNLNLNAANLGALGRFHSQGACSSTSVPQFGYRSQPNFLSNQAKFQQPKFGTANPFPQNSFSSVNNGVQPKNVRTDFPFGGRIPYEAVKATNGITNGTANPKQIYQQQTQKNPLLFNTAGSLDFNFSSSSGTPNSNYISTNYGNTGSLNGSHPAPNYSNNIFGGNQLTSGGNVAAKASLVPNGCGNSAGYNNSFGLVNSVYDSNITAAQMGNRSYSTSLPPRVDLSSVGFPNANQFSPRLPKANAQDNNAAQPPLQLQQYGLFNNLDNKYIFNAMDLPSSKSHTSMTYSNLFSGKEITNTISQQMGFQFPHQKQSGKEVQNSDYSRLSGLVEENALLINKESLGQKQGSGKQMDVDPKGKSVVVDETPEENFLLDQEWDDEFPDSLFSNDEHISE